MNEDRMYALLKSGEISQATFDEFYPQITQMNEDRRSKLKGERRGTKRTEDDPQITQIDADL